MRKIPYESLATLSRVLVALCAVFFTAALLLLLYFVDKRHELTSLRARLLSQEELQSRLLASQASDHSAYPHLERQIGYVLNPYMRRSTWQAADPEGDYAINSIGLRGEEIARKEAGTTRILLVGDSVIFGWKLRDEDMISSRMTDHLEERLPSTRIEVLTVALPGWNVLSAKAFLEAHLHILEPDLIVWKLQGNDVDDVLGVVPPGRFSAWNSPQKEGQAAFFPTTHRHRTLAMPAILERWQANLSAIESMQSRYGVPLLILSNDEPFFHLVLDRYPISLPLVRIPRRFYKDQPSWCVAEPDCHPSPWATNIIALGLLDKLARLERIPSLSFTAGEQEIVDAFRAEESRDGAAAEARDFARAQLARVPEAFEAGEEKTSDSVLYGIDAVTGRMQRNGVLFVRASQAATVLELDLEVPANPGAYPRSAIFTVRSQQGEESRLEVEILSRRTAVRIPLPRGSANAVQELSWNFDYANCTSPVRCSSGVLHTARLR